MGELKLEELALVIDTREQLPYDLSPCKVVRKCLHTGDYSLIGFEDKITIERKSLDDFVGSISQGRDRFEREIERLKVFEEKVILVEGSAHQIAEHRYLSRTHPNSVMGTIAKYQLLGIPVMLASSRAIAQDFCKRFLYLSAKYRLRKVANSDT